MERVVAVAFAMSARTGTARSAGTTGSGRSRRVNVYCFFHRPPERLTPSCVSLPISQIRLNEPRNGRPELSNGSERTPKRKQKRRQEHGLLRASWRVMTRTIDWGCCMRCDSLRRRWKRKKSALRPCLSATGKTTTLPNPNSRGALFQWLPLPLDTSENSPNP